METTFHFLACFSAGICCVYDDFSWEEQAVFNAFLTFGADQLSASRLC